MNVLWMNIPPHTLWGWAFEIAVGIGILWIIGFGIVVFIGWLLDNWDQPSYQSRALEQQRQQQQMARREIALREKLEAARAGHAIDEIRRRAEAELRRLAQLARTTCLTDEGARGPQHAPGLACGSS